MSREDEPKNDSAKLRLLAQWFDVYDFNRRVMDEPLKDFLSPKEDDVREDDVREEVQIFLRELADRLEEK